MVRAALAAVAALLLVAVLSLLIIESRAVKEDYYVAHAERLRAIEASRNDIAAISEGARSAFDDGRAIPASIRLAFAALKTNSELLKTPFEPSAPDSIVPDRLSAYDEQLQQFLDTGEAFAARQNALAEALRLLQEESPNVVKDLRRFNLRIESQNAFSLAIDLMEFAMGRGQFTTEQLSQRIAALRNDQTVAREAPGRLDAFAAAANSIVEEHTAAEAALAGITNSTIVESLADLSIAMAGDNRVIVSRAERARLLLALCAVLLLLGAGFAMFRLQHSYRDLNKSNAALEKLNNSLEQMVADRTEELSRAIDELKESQVQLVQAEKMSSLGELVAGISHEINTPLWYLMSNSAVIQERLNDIAEFLVVAEKMVVAARSRAGVKEAISAGLVDMNQMLAAGMKDDIDEAKDLIKDSMEGLEELTELAQSLKDFSRLDRAKQGEFNVNEGLNKTLLIIKNKIKHKVSVHKHFGEVPNILCSPSQINQIFLNLIVNAADAIDKEGDIVLQTWEKDGKVNIRVSDTGCGISEEALAKVRDPFFTTKEVGKGTGLGLSIVDQIITAHHGKLTIESQPGKGTTIIVELPLKPPAAPAATPDGKSKATAEPPAATPADETTAAHAKLEVPAADAGSGEEADWAADTNVSEAPAEDEPPAAADDADDDWAGDTNVVDEEAAPAAAGPVEAEPYADGDAEEDNDWAADTHVAAGTVAAAKSFAASNDSDDADDAQSASDDDTDWAGDTNVSDDQMCIDIAENDDEVLDEDLSAGDEDHDIDALAETDIRTIDHAALQAAADDQLADTQSSQGEFCTDEDADTDDIDPHAETTVSPIDTGEDSNEATVVADWNLENEVIELFAKSGRNEDRAADDDASDEDPGKPASRSSTPDEPPATTDV